MSQKKYRTRLGQTIVEGVRAVASAIQAGADVVELIATHEAASMPDVAPILSIATAPVHIVENRVMQRITNVEHPQGLMAVVRVDFEALSESYTGKRILALDGVQDPGNVGTLIRTAAWFGIEAILIGSGTVDPFSPKVVRATMGSLWEIKLIEAGVLSSTLDSLRNRGYSVYAADLEGTDAREWRPEVLSVLVLGNEAHGIRPEVLDKVDVRVTIPGGRPDGVTESLNVATAGAVLMYQWAR